MQFAAMEDSTVKVQPKFRFNRENAKEMSRRGNEAKKRKAQERLELIAKAQAIPVLPPDQDYRERRLTRVRAQLEKVDAMIEKERNPQSLERLARAQASLSTQEFQLAGRPLPGMHRPKSEGTKVDRKTAFQPLDADPLAKVA